MTDSPIEAAAGAPERDAAPQCATGVSPREDVARLIAGRPRVGEERPETRQWRLRVPAALDDAVRAVADRDGLTVSVVVRRAVAAQLIGEVV